MSIRASQADLNKAIGKILRYGVILSSATLALGLILMLLAPPPGTPGTLQGMLASSFGRPTLSISSLSGGIANGSAVSILQLGTLILVATPIVRVAASVLLFLREKDMQYVGIASLVLVMLLLAIFVIGPAEA